MTPAPAAVVFDLGNVLIPWDPRRLYRSLLPDEAAVERFLAEICTPAWNHALDAGGDFRAAVEALAVRHPAHRALVLAYDERWEEMLGDPIAPNLALLDGLAAAGVPLYALTNWSREKFAVARRRFGFLSRFRAIVVSGEEGMTKPDPAIFRLLLDRHGLEPGRTVFIDDSEPNVRTAAALGFRAVHYREPGRLRRELNEMGLAV